MRPGWENPPYNVTSVSLGGHVVLTNIGASYRVLALAVVDCTNVTAIDYLARWNKIGTGTQSWQLWNATDGVELAVFNDSAAAGDNKTGATTVAVALAGMKELQVRGKSTTAADDPIFYGASVVLR
jgi:hypothetical protein